MSATINLDIAKRVDIVCRKNDTMTFSITMTDSTGAPIDLVGYSLKMQVRSSDVDETAALTLDYTASANPEDDYDSTSDQYDSDGGIFLKRTADSDDHTEDPYYIIGVSSDSINFSGDYVYDLQADSGESVTTWLYGIFRVNEDITE